ncbi:MAG: SagB/ThcOx family dehydrogenase [Anaerolineae bacterium]|nr:SagB/ThcOx family dehydrogenase [Anaerolineae bacterium]
MDSGIGDRFQSETKYVRGQMLVGGLDWANQPEAYKTYPRAQTVAFDAPSTKGGASLWSALRDRRSVRSFGGRPVTKLELSRLLWAAQGITHRTGEFAFRTAPSAGALYPVETYVVVHQVEGIGPGIYHYQVEAHALEELQSGDFRLAVARAALNQRMAAEADAVFIWTAIFARSKWKYDERAYRYIYLDAGHIAQNVALAAVAQGLGSCQIAALYDEEVNALLGVDGQTESVLYMTVVGREA